MPFLSAKRLRRMATPLVLSIFLLLPVISEGQYGHRCEVIPKDPYIEFGSNIKIKFKKTCNKTISDSHGKIYWTINNKSIDESLYETNTTFAAVTIYNLSLPKAIVQCHSHLTQQVLGGTIIQTYWKPRNISCVTYISQQDFTCRWEHKIKPTSKITYTVYRKWENSQDAWESDHCSSGSMSCTFNKSLPMLSKLNYITVRAESTVWETISDTLELDPWDTMKIDPPKNVRVVPLPAHLRVEWERPGGTDFLDQVIHCQVKYAKHVMDTSMNTVAKTASVTSVEVESCTNHTVSVRCALDKAPWSEWSRQVTVLSSLNVSTVQLDLWRKMDAPDNTGTRTVHLMWKSISPACKAIDGYRLTYMADEKHMPDRHLDTVVDKASITVDQRAYRVTLAAYRGDTTFSEQSIYVPAVGQSLPQVRGAQASAHDGDIQVSWVVPPLYLVHGYIIDWTTDGDTYTWLQSQDTHITLTGLQPFKLYNITVTPLYDDQTGLEKVIQICSVQRAPGNISSVDVHVQDKSAQVNWTAVPQSQCSGDVVNYTVFYKTETQPELNVTVNSRKQGVTLEPLQPDTRYSVHVMARAVTGATNSSVIHFTTSRYGRTFIIMSCVFGGFGVIIVLVTGLFCVIQWKRFKGKIVPNPGLSSLEFWSSQDCHKIQPFNNPSELETFCEMIYPCEVNTITDDIMGSTSTEDRDIQDMGKETVCDQTERWSSGFGSRTFCDSQPREESSNLGLAPTLLPLLAQQDGEINLLESTTSEDSSSEPSDLQASESCPVNPYRLQTPGECPVRLGLGGGEATSGTTEESRSLLNTQQHSSIAPLTAYVTLDMFEHRVRESKRT
ncbi:interleukin-31 receptor subunit alpha isoform X1 [Oncorhynchus tshawytscha]|uniref:Fibronectin type-III domain-containing protein n=1 Tax=Oncorhynchus tshawytscha TaxID=74940 RepID=A0A8C8FRQ0_ONCTS|nr:interleukin-31 receptor subunit alpha isoform X1 [Oncorhynchus tshawytscha]